MPERIGFDRKIRRAWLDLAAETVLRERDPAAVHAALDRALASEVRGSEARRKTVNLLTRIWLRVPQAHRPLRDEALSLWNDVTGTDRLWLHWGLALLAYPFFRDVVTVVGRLLRLQERFTTGQVYRQIVARWGERTTLKKATQRVITSLVDWGIFHPVEEGRGLYVAIAPPATTHAELPLWLLECALRSHPNDALPLYDLLRLSSLFPFQIDIGLDRLHASARFLILREGDGRELVTVRERGRG